MQQQLACVAWQLPRCWSELSPESFPVTGKKKKQKQQFRFKLNFRLMYFIQEITSLQFIVYASVGSSIRKSKSLMENFNSYWTEFSSVAFIFQKYLIEHFCCCEHILWNAELEAKIAENEFYVPDMLQWKLDDAIPIQLGTRRTLCGTCPARRQPSLPHLTHIFVKRISEPTTRKSVGKFLKKSKCSYK